MSKIRHLLHTSRGQDIVLYLTFILVSYGVWVVLKLNDTTHHDFKVELNITDVPQNVHFISEVPKEIQASVRDKGLQLAKNAWANRPELNLNYNDFKFDEINGRITVTRQALNSKIRNIFGTNAFITATNPDSLSLIITKRPPTRAKVKADIDVLPIGQCVISGPIKIEPDSVLIYTPSNSKFPARTITTEKLIRRDVKDTLTVELNLLTNSQTKAEPSKVQVTIPIEPLMSKEQEVPVQLKNAPQNGNVVLFPTKVTVSYLLPMSVHSAEKGTVIVTGDYSKRSANRIPVYITSYPTDYKVVEVAVDSVDYIFEQL